MIKNRNILKFISIALIELLFCPDGIFGADLPERYSVPEKYGSVKMIHTAPNSDKWIIHIQDAHCNSDAQMNIAAILQRLSRNEALDLVLLEGSEGVIDPAPLRDYPDHKARNTVSKYLVNSADISGAEYFSILSDLGVPLYGIEEEDLYTKNLEALVTVMNLKNRNMALLDMLNQCVNDAILNRCSKEVQEFVSWKTRYDHHQADVYDYVSYIKQYIDIEHDAYPNISFILDLTAKKNAVDFGTLEEETADLLNYFSANLAREKLAELFKLNLRFKVGELSASAFFQKLRSFMQEEEINEERYPHIVQYCGMIDLYASIDHRVLADEIAVCEAQAVSTCVKSQFEMDCYDLWYRLGILRNYMNLELTKNEKAYYSANTELFALPAMRGLLQSAAPDKAGSMESALNELDSNRKNISSFYEYAYKRDEILVEKTLEYMDSTNSSSAALVAGGFHTEGITRILAERDVNVAVVVPKISKITDQDHYFSIISHTRSPYEQFIETALNSLADTSFLAQNQIGPDQMRRQIKLTKAISLFMGESADILHAQNRAFGPQELINSLNSMLQGYDTHSVRFEDMTFIDGYRFYMLSINGRKTVFYFEDKGSPAISKIMDSVVDDIASILETKIELDGEKNVTVLRPEIMARLEEQRSVIEARLQSQLSGAIQMTADLKKQLKNAIVDFAYLNDQEFTLEEVVNMLRQTYGMVFDYRADLQPVIEEMIRENWLNGNFDIPELPFTLDLDVRLAYYLSMMAEDENYFPKTSELSEMYRARFRPFNIENIMIEQGVPMEAVLSIVRQMDSYGTSGKLETVFGYTLPSGDAFEGRIITNENGFSYLSISSIGQSAVDNFGAGFDFDMPAVPDVELVQEQTALTVMIENNRYIVSLVEMGDEEKPANILLQEEIPFSETARESLMNILNTIIVNYVPYTSLNSLVIMNQDRVRLFDISEGIEPEDIQGLIPDAEFGNILISEINGINQAVANIIDGEPLDSLSPILDERSDDSDIIRKLSAYNPHALLEIARTSRNSAYLKVLAGQDLYSQPDSPVRLSDFNTFRIKEVLIDNKFTPTDSLRELAMDSHFFEYLLKRNPQKLKRLIDHEQSIPELLELVGDQLEEIDDTIDSAVAEDLKTYIIQSKLADDTLLLKYLNDPSLKVRVALARSQLSDVMAHDPAEEVRIEVAKNPKTTLIILKTYLDSEGTAVKTALASNTMIDREIVDSLMAETDENLKAVLARTLSAESLPLLEQFQKEISAYLIRLMNEHGSLVDEAIARSKGKLDEQVLLKLLEQGPKVQELVAARSDITPKVLKELYDIKADAIRHQLVINSVVDLPTSEYISIINKSKNEKDGWKTRRAIASKKHLKESVMEILAEDENVLVRAQIAHRHDLKSDLFEVLAADPVPLVRSFIAANSEAPIGVILGLRNDETLLSEGLVTERGLLEGITPDMVDRLNNQKTTVLTRLASNPRMLQSHKLTDRLIRDYKYHIIVLRTIRDQRQKAVDLYNAGDFHGAKDILKMLANSHYAPYGTHFQLANAMIHIRDFQRAEEYYKRAVEETNNVAAQIALTSLQGHVEVSPHLLYLETPLLTILQNFHNVLPIQQADHNVILEFIQDAQSTVSGATSIENIPDYISPSSRWVDLLKNENVEQLVALQVYALRDVLSQRLIDIPGVLKVLRHSLPTMLDYRNVTAKMDEVRGHFWSEVIDNSNLSAELKTEMRKTSPELVELFMRGGVRALAKREEYNEFRQSIIMDNVPSMIREDVARSVWLEFLEMTEDMLFSEPDYFRRLNLVKQYGTFGGIDQTLKISLSLSGGDFYYGVGDINSVVRSEGAHSITSGIFRNLGEYRYVDELQDRAAHLSFPADLDNSIEGQRVLAIYTNHDALAMDLYHMISTKLSSAQIIETIRNFKGKNLVEDYTVRNALTALSELDDTTLGKRLIGEALFYLYRDESNLELIDEELPLVIQRLGQLKDDIKSLRWNVRAFFEGGAYLETYNQPFPTLAPPLDLLVGVEALDKLNQPNINNHYTGEWLHYLLRMRVRELLVANQLTQYNLRRFYTTAVIYLSAVTKHGELFGHLANIKTKFEQADQNVLPDVINMLNNNRITGLSAVMQEHMLDLRARASSLIKFDKMRLMALLQKSTLDRFVDTAHPSYPMTMSLANHIIDRLKKGQYPEAAYLTSNLMERLRKHQYLGYAQEIERSILPMDEEARAFVPGFFSEFERYDDLRKTAATTLPQVTEVIKSLTPETVFGAVENRQVAAAEPEKVMLKEIGSQLTKLLLMTGEITFSQFMNLATDYYTGAYQVFKKSGQFVPQAAFVPTSPVFWSTLKDQLFGFLKRYSFINMASLLEKFKEDFSMNAKTDRGGAKLYTHWSSVLPVFYIFGGEAVRSVMSMVGGAAFIALGIFGIFKAGQLLARYFAEQRERKFAESGTDTLVRPEFSQWGNGLQPLTPEPDIKAVDLIRPYIVSSVPEVRKRTTLIMDFDSLSSNWDVVSVIEYYLKNDLADGRQIFFVSAEKSQRQMRHILNKAGIVLTPAIRTIGIDDLRAGLEPGAQPEDVFRYLQRNYNISVQESLLLVSSSYDSSFTPSFMNQGGIIFQLTPVENIGSIFTFFDTALSFSDADKIPYMLPLNDVSSQSPYYDWFMHKKESYGTVSVDDLIQEIERRGKQPSPQDMAGISFGILPAGGYLGVPNSKLKLNPRSDIIESSL
ncbi:MAG: hypothetical protein AB1454_00270 [Candidatus Auribacterota bacterium]